MRIDYFVVSEQLKERLVSCEMHGRGIELEGMHSFLPTVNQHSIVFEVKSVCYFFAFLTGFQGSDHCPVTLELSPKETESLS